MHHPRSQAHDRRRVRGLALPLSLLLGLAGCAHVELSSGGEAVDIVQPEIVAACQKVGTASASTKPRIWMFARSDETIRDELTTLARNEAAKLGGNALVPTSPIEEGRQSYDVYRCGAAPR